MFFLFEVVKILALYSRRWQELGLLLPEACFWRMRNLLPLNALGMGLGTQMPMLKKVVLFRWWEDDQDDSASESMTEDEIIDVFAEAELEEVYLSRFALDMWVVPWGQLLRFQGHRNTVEDILEMLHNAPQLEECTVTSTVDDSWGLPLSAANLPRLRSLTLDIRRSSTLIDHLILPALENLVLQMVEKGGDYDEDDPEDMDSEDEDEAVGTFDATAFVGFMQRSGCALQRLHLCVQFITVSRLTWRLGTGVAPRNRRYGTLLTRRVRLMNFDGP
ncbi:hypothetical protein FPV67DRAFT_351374 [Lyophyllum atratum]|nr:hypothetical protein FPV67DRAFT_351374 [Lyophyllum atratum]